MSAILKFLKDCSIANGSPNIPNDTINDLTVYSHVRLKHKQKRKWKKQEFVAHNLNIENYCPRSTKDQGALSAYFGLVKTLLDVEYDHNANFYHHIWYDGIVTFMLDHLSWLNSRSEQNLGSIYPSSALISYSSTDTHSRQSPFDLDNHYWLRNGIISDIPSLLDRIWTAIDKDTLYDCVEYLRYRGLIVKSRDSSGMPKFEFDKNLLQTSGEIKHDDILAISSCHVFIYTVLSTIQEWCTLTNNLNVSFNTNLRVFPLTDDCTGDQGSPNCGLFIGMANMVPNNPVKSIDPQIKIPIIFTSTRSLKPSITKVIERVFSSQPRRLFLPCVIQNQTSVMCYIFHRSGGMSSEPIDCVLEPEKLCKLFLGFLLMDEQSMGFDTTFRVDRKTPGTESTYWTHPRSGIEYVLKDTISRQDLLASGIFVRQVIQKADNLTPEDKADRYFLKTFWEEAIERRNSTGSISNSLPAPREVGIYHIANEHGVRFIPNCIDFGYMYYPDGELQDTNSIYWRYLPLDNDLRFKNRVNTWMLLSVPGNARQLCHHNSLQEIFLSLRDVIIALWDLYKVGILHCSISKESLWIIQSSGTISGMLGGLEMASQTDIRGECEPCWKADRKYLPIDILKNAGARYQFMHDLESIFWWVIVEAFPVVTKSWSYLSFATLASRKQEFLDTLGNPTIHNSVCPLYRTAIPYILELRSVVFDMAGRASLDASWMYEEVEQLLSKAVIDVHINQSAVFVDEDGNIVESISI
ncbi:hypothetical protein AWJ20_2949 [Sugiyamaella lignohabitans]|uniref:Fungal-type protein kinase domain-containing protein n=1 Tax=Sugiyamaella lignohabitans TaxID=796027 RepID=A0A167FI01_9ASCO|nr:uncharacterized protein AWJ20_2949 [Sugiyamaella lignohabitans]ANB15322.1 hypothetical protein AWJ20_2949 [Sugiyamaella lignohabitans]